MLNSNNQASSPESNSVVSVLDDFSSNLERSQKKYPNNRQMFDGLLGEIHELKRAYEGDGNIRSEALDVAVCAFRIAQEGDAGGNEKLSTLPDWLAWGAAAPSAEPMVATAWYVERRSPGKRDHGMKLGPFWKREEAECWLDERHALRALVSVASKSVSNEDSVIPSGQKVLAGWVQYINGVQTQKFARNEAELENLKWNEALSEKAEYFPVYF